MKKSLSHVEQLEFDLPRKLLEELVSLFERMPSGVLAEDIVASTVADQQGVYQLFKGDKLVYIGKTDSEAGLKKRLLRHAQKIQMRHGLDIGDVRFKAIRVYVFTAMDLESLLIKHYRDAGYEVEWQHTGFGANDPGRKRDTTNVDPKKNFDGRYPIDIDIEVDIQSEGSKVTAADLLQRLKKLTSYNIRFQNLSGKSRKPHKELAETVVDIEPGVWRIRRLLEEISAALGESWQITKLPGYVIVYRETAPHRYPAGIVISKP